MPPAHSDSHGTTRPPRPRANTSFSAFAWKRNRPESMSAPLASTPAAPVQTLPIETLIQSLIPPAVPSLSHARLLVTALSTQTPAPPPATLTPILTGLCSTDSPASLQAVGFDILTAYCICGATLSTSDKLTYFDMIRTSCDVWAQEVWEPRFKALNALMSSSDDTAGVDDALLGLLSGWVEKATGDLIASAGASPVDKQEKERAVEVLSEALTSWFEKLEASGRISDKDVLSIFEFYQNLVTHAITYPLDSSQPSPTPPTPFRENSAGFSTPIRHRRHPSSASNLTSPLSNASPQQRHTTRNPVHLVISIYNNFLSSRITRLPPSYLTSLLPLLFRILSSIMSPLPVISPRPPVTTERQSIEHHIIKTITALLSGPYATSSLIILKRLLLPLPSSTEASDAIMAKQIKISLGAVRTLRLQVRHVLEDRMAVRYVQRDMSMTATHAGTPSSMMTLDQHLLDRAERAWRKEGAAIWDARKISFLLVRSIKAWIDIPCSLSNVTCREKIFEEIAGLLKDVLYELDDKEYDQDSELDDSDTAGAVGETLYQLMAYVKTLRNEDGSPVLIPLENPISSSTPLLRILADILTRGRNVQHLNPSLPAILLSVADQLVDTDSQQIPVLMTQQHSLNPTSPEWLDNWRKLLTNSSIFAPTRPLTRRAVTMALQTVFTLIKDMPSYRRRLSELVSDFWMGLVEEANEGVDGAAVWKILGDEIILRSSEDNTEELFTPIEESLPSPGNLTIHKILVPMLSVSGYCDCYDDMNAGAEFSQLSPLIPVTPSNTLASGAGSPIVPRTSNEPLVSGKDREGGREGGNMQQQIMSLLSFAGSRHQSQNHVPQLASLDDPSSNGNTHLEAPPAPITSPSPIITTCRGMAAVVALIDVFSNLAFVESEMMERQARLAIYVFGQLLKLLRTAQCTKVRLVILQLLMRLRADRDHRVYLKSDPVDNEPLISRLAQLIYRTPGTTIPITQLDDTRSEDIQFERARPIQVFERDGRKTSRGRSSRTSRTVSRSRSRVPGHPRSHQSNTVPVKQRELLWHISDPVSFSLETSNRASQLLITYDPYGPNETVVLPVSDYMDVLVEIVKTERDWEVLSFVLVYLPAQLANKHFWCGPMARESVANLLSELSRGISDGSIGRYALPEDSPGPLRARDCQGLAYYTLSVLTSYQGIFDVKKRYALVDLFLAGLGGKGDTVIICLHALSICAFEMETAMIKALPRILEKLSQIMSNPSMAVHILTFMSMIASLPHLYSNFTENDFKMVFGVALQYLQHHNRPETLAEIQFSLSQHVRIVSYYVVYVWFLALKFSDRPRHIKFIARQLLLANEGRDDVDDPTEVCFDWLARYTYSSSDPKPAPSLLGEILSNPAERSTPSSTRQEKSWVLGYSIVTVRLLALPGWMEIIARRASGTTKFLAKSENVPLVDLGDVNPDMITIPASLMMDKDPRTSGAIITPLRLTASSDGLVQQEGELGQVIDSSEEAEDDSSRPDPITGYVWSGSAPSQRRKQVDMDPSYFPLQLSAYPDIRNRVHTAKIVRDTRALASAIRSLDRIPVIDTHKVGILYVAPGQTNEVDILGNSHGSPAYTRFLEGIGRLIKIRGQLDVYTGGLDPDEDGEYAYAWWDDIGQILYHTATLMPNHADDKLRNFKKRHIGNDFVRIVWNDSGLPYKFDTLTTEFQFVNIVIEPHSVGAIAAYSNNSHENEYFKLSVQRAEGMVEFTPIGDFKIVSADSLAPLVRQISLVADWYASIFKDTVRDTEQNEIITNWRARLDAIRKFATTVPDSYEATASDQGVMGQEAFRDFTPGY